MKIKQKKQVNLPQLIEWAWENKIKGRMFLTESDYCVGFDRHGFIYFNSINSMPLDQTFTVEVEEEITEDIVIPKLIKTYEKDCLEDRFGYQRIAIFEHHSIGLALNRARSRREKLKTLHILNDDDTHTLIWRDGKLVE